MKNRTLKLLICLMMAILLIGVLVGCDTDSDADYKYVVTFDYNMGDLISTPPTAQYLGVYENSLISVRPGVNDHFPLATISGYYFDNDWYLPMTDANDEPIKDEHGRVKLGEKWDFRYDRVSEDITLYANFVISPYVIFKDVDTDEEIVRYNAKRPNTPLTEENVVDNIEIEKKGYTWLKKVYYADNNPDPSQRQMFDWTDFVIQEDTVIYIEFIEGNWAVVYEPSEFRNAINQNLNIYLMDDIDFGGRKNEFVHSGVYDKTIEGNNHSVTGIVLASRCTIASDKSYYGLLENFGGKMRNISFDITMYFNYVLGTTGSGKPNTYAALLVGQQLGESAEFENVTLTGELVHSVENINMHDLTVNKAIGNKNDPQGIDVSGVTITYDAARTREQVPDVGGNI